MVFVITPPKGEVRRHRRLVGFSKGIIKRVSLERLDVDACFKLPMKPGERLTCGHYSDNGTNFVIGSSHATLFIASVATLASTRVDINYCRIENIGNCNTFENDNQQRAGQ